LTSLLAGSTSIWHSAQESRGAVVSQQVERSGRTVVITGGGTGIGRGTASMLAADGWRVAVIGRRKDVLDTIAAETDGVAVTADLSQPCEVERAARELVEALGTVDGLVLNAGGAQHGALESVADVAAGASKAALNRWILQLASELGAQGITANALAPGFVPDTELYASGTDPSWT
jgi:3-oxoacyl-[acyl-carrier protein] reductase